MSDTGFTTFSASLSKTTELLHEIEEAYGWPKERRRQSYAALRSVLHALRDRLTVQETADFAAQLPMLVRGIYYEGWDPSRVPLKLHREEFLDRVAQAFPYEVEGGMERLVRTVLEVLHRRYISEGELEDIRSSLPRDLAGVVP
jgi:uncharacterized protein (DUF2267 family)